MRTCRSPVSSITETRRSSPWSSGCCSPATASRNRRLISRMISRCRGRRRAEQRQRPFLQRLGPAGVVCVGAGPLRDLPRPDPVHQVLVDQEPPLSSANGDGRVRVVQLHRAHGESKSVERLLPRSGGDGSCPEASRRRRSVVARAAAFFPATGSSFGYSTLKSFRHRLSDPPRVVVARH